MRYLTRRRAMTPEVFALSRLGKDPERDVVWEAILNIRGSSPIHLIPEASVSEVLQMETEELQGTEDGPEMWVTVRATEILYKILGG